MNKTLERYRELLNKQQQAKWVASQSLILAKRDYRRASKFLIAMQEAQKVLQTIAMEIQDRAHSSIVTLVSQCLSAVFDEPYQFKLVFEQKRGRTEARPTFYRNGHEVNPLKASGGGVVDIASFALRLSCVLLSKPRLRKLLVLDEPFKHVSAEYIPRVKTMLERLASELGVQFIIVTHIRELQGDQHYKLPFPERKKRDILHATSNGKTPKAGNKIPATKRRSK